MGISPAPGGRDPTWAVNTRRGAQTLGFGPVHPGPVSFATQRRPGKFRKIEKQSQMEPTLKILQEDRNVREKVKVSILKKKQNTERCGTSHTKP